MKILMIGPQGSGKSTQAKFLSEDLNLPFISTGEIFRRLVEEEGELGSRIKGILKEGRLVDDQTTSEIVRSKLSMGTEKGFVMDGYPRNLSQLKIFDPDFDKVIYLEVPNWELVRRLKSRGREDDTEEAIMNRLRLYNEQTKPLLDYYHSQGILTKINGQGSIDDIRGQIRKSLKS